MRSPFLAAQWRIYARHLAASRRPILVGPWRSEGGFELLYWIPFLCSLRERYGISRDRLITIRHGGSLRVPPNGCGPHAERASVPTDRQPQTECPGGVGTPRLCAHGDQSRDP